LNGLIANHFLKLQHLSWIEASRVAPGSLDEIGWEGWLLSYKI
jgi:hypothetical protein